VAVHDLVVKDDALVLGTHGRSIWILDDLVPVRALAPEVLSSSVRLFEPSIAVAWRYASEGRNRDAGANPPAGVLIHYYLSTESKSELTLDVLDARGQLVRRLSSVPRPPDGSDDFDEASAETKKGDLPTGAGVQRAVWDLRYEGARKIRGAKIDSGEPAEGPFVLAGTYTLRLHAAGQTVSATLRVAPDPRVTISDQEREAQLSLALAIRDDISRVTDMVEGLRRVREQLAARRTLLSGAGNAQGFVSGAATLIASLDQLEDKLHNPRAEVVYDILAMKSGAHLYSRLSPLLSWVTEGDGAPTEGARSVYAELKGHLDACAAEYQRLVGDELSALNKRAEELGLSYVTAPK
jgi:hypothetical protein